MAAKKPAPMSPATSACSRAAVLVAGSLAEGPDRWPKSVQAVVRSLVCRLAAARGLPRPELPYPHDDAAEAELDTVAVPADWSVLDIGEIHQELLALELAEAAAALTVRQSGGRHAQGSWYTPQPLAREMTRLSLTVAIEQLIGGEPEQLLRLRAVDPACGAGVFLVEAAHRITDNYACRLAGTDTAPPLLAERLRPTVIYECVFGMDIDPVAVDLARASLWFEVGGTPPFAWLDQNIACVNPLAGPNELPARLLDAMGEPPLETARAAR